jgi:hypothetical protein
VPDAALKNEPRPQVDKFREAFEPAGHLREFAAEKETATLLQRYGAEPDIQKAAAEFDQAHKIEERFVKDFEGRHFTSRRFPMSTRRV